MFILNITDTFTVDASILENKYRIASIGIG